MLHKLLKRSDQEIHIFANTIIILFGVILFLGVVLLVLKHYALKSALPLFVTQARIQASQQFNGARAVDDAGLIASTIGTTPSTKPLFDDKTELQKYVLMLSRQTGRDIVVMDRTQHILADTVTANVGKRYDDDKEDEAGEAIDDGQARSFIEKSIDYPGGIDQVVVSVKDATGQTVGALVLSVYPVMTPLAK